MENSRFEFRVWDKGNEQYLDPEDMDCVCHLPNGYFTIATWDGIQGDMKYWADEDIVVEMSTGLKDKNGNLIYESDYVKIGENTYKVFWNKTKISLENILKNDIIDIEIDFSMEIIGNEHETKFDKI